MRYFLVSHDTDAYMNLARDEFFLNRTRAGDMILYLYVNGNAVIIGRNQNPYRECNLNQLDADGVQLVRRVSGGGAVYHDAGNLNFSFICSEDLYDEAEQTGMILNALTRLGIRAQTTGRNDIEIDGRKFSGNAFSARGGNRQRHGTLLVNANLSVFDRYLNAPRQKLEAKGVKSVKARVCNLTEFREDLTVERMADALREAYDERYGPSVPPTLSGEDEAEIYALYRKHQSYEWRMGEAPKFDYTFESRFSFGTTQICVSVEGGEIVRARVFSDSLDVALPGRIEALLRGCRFSADAMARALSAEGARGNEIAQTVSAQIP